jgi:hypothetical protein
MMVAIHQPNYAPWGGYFHKIARADLFIFLDDAQYPRSSYVNRVQILENGGAAWLTVPAKPRLGTPINQVMPAQADWPLRHLSRLRNAYAGTAWFRQLWPGIEAMYQALPAGRLAESNRLLIETVAGWLGLQARFACASDFPNEAGLTGGDRLVDLIGRAGGSAYLSGRGGANYQDPDRFAEAGISLAYTDFTPTAYPQGGGTFVAGLSILDMLFSLGPDATAARVACNARAAAKSHPL